MKSQHGSKAKRLIQALPLCGCSLLAFALAAAQTTTGSIYGTVADASGAIVTGAEITVTNVATGEGHMAATDRSGNYLFPGLAPGNYIANAKRTGFQLLTESGIVVSANQNVHVDFALRPGNVSEEVTVNATTTLVDTRESQLGQTVDRERIVNLPLNGRDPYSLVQLVPGVTNFAAGAAIGSQAGTNFSVNGNQPDEDNYYLDGAFDQSSFRNGGNKIPNPDALEEFRLLTSNFDAEYGRSPGGVVNIITRSGTNRFNGVVYEYVRNNVFNAKNYFSTSVTPLVQNQFGGAFGGPIHRDKAFFFLSYEGLRVQTPFTVNSSALVTPTPAEAKGDFSGDSTAVKATLAHLTTCGTAYVICPTALDPVAQNLLKTVPLSDPVTHITAQAEAPANSSADEGLARVDYQLTAAHKLSATFFNSQGLAVDPGGGGTNQILSYSSINTTDNQINAVVSDTWIVSPRTLNMLRIFDTLNHYIISPGLSGNTLADLGSQIPQASSPAIQPQVTVNGYFKMGSGGGGQNDQYDKNYGISDTVNLTRGNHSLKLGGSFVSNRFTATGAFLGSGQFVFSGSTTGNALADFLEGKANVFTQNNGNSHHVHQQDPALFVQDDWHIKPRLTLDLGLHWEVYAPYIGDNNDGTFVPNVQSKRFPTAPIGLLSSGDLGVPDGIQHTSYTKFAPRIGFAYDVFGKGSTSLRGAYGIFYASARATLYENIEQQPFTLSVVTNKTANLVTPYAPNPAPFPYVVSTTNPVFTSGATLAGIPAGKDSIPYVQEYNLTVEQQFGSNWSTSISYVGSVSRKFYLIHDVNSPAYIPGAAITTAGLNARRPYEPTPTTFVFGAINLTDPIANASYNSLQAVITRRFAHGFSLLASYVWSKSLDIQANFAEGSGTLVNENSLAYDRGPAATEVPNAFVASYLWAIPGVQRFGAFGRCALNGWQINGITTLDSGSPFNVTSGVDTNLDGVNNDRPNRLGNTSLGSGRTRRQKVAQFFNTAAFGQVPAGTPYGNLSRNALIGPGNINTDLSIFKTFPIFRESKLQFRGEVFNVFNNVNLGNPNANLNTTTGATAFGTISSAGAPRIAQLALRYSF